MKIHDYIKKYLLDESHDVLTDEMIEKHISENDQLSAEAKDDLLEQLQKGDLESISPGLWKWRWIGAVVIIILIVWWLLS